MKEYILISVILIVASVAYLKLAIKFKIIDKPNQRSSHTKITVRGGGILFTLAGVLFFVFNDFQYFYFTLGLILIALVSFIDDIKTLSSSVRFPFQLLAILLVLYQLDLFINTNILWVIWLVICGVGFINFFNFMDGINGITGLYSISVLVGVFLLNEEIDVINRDLIVYTLISLVIFGFYNFRKKAVFFAGDIGSISLSILIVFMIFSIVNRTGAPVILLLLVVYGADALTTLLYRKFILKEKITEPHRHHLYQKLVDVKKMSHINVSLLYALVQFLVVILVLNTYNLEMFIQYLLLFLGILLFGGVYVLIYRNILKVNKNA